MTKKSKISAFLKDTSRERIILLVLIAEVIVFSLINTSFFDRRVFVSILESASINGCLAIGITFVIITGGIDLSVGAVLAVVAITCANLAVGGMNPVLVLIIGLLIGTCCGLLNGLITTKVGIQPFIATLGTCSVFRGIAYIVTGGWPITNIPKNFRQILNGKLLFDIRIFIFAVIILAIVYGYILKNTKFGTYLYAVGSNDESARLSGVDSDRVKILAYMACGIATALAALIYIARLSSVEASAGSGYELDAIAAAAIGGASLAGGRGSIKGTIIGALIIACLSTGLIVIGMESFTQYVATGLVILLAASFETIRIKLDAYYAKKKQLSKKV